MKLAVLLVALAAASILALALLVAIAPSMNTKHTSFCAKPCPNCVPRCTIGAAR
jgi:hypothetical protein